MNVRRNERYDSSCDRRNALFKSVSFSDYLPRLSPDHIFNPYWGDCGAHPEYDRLVAPDPATELFGMVDAELQSLVVIVPPESTKDTYLLCLARASLVDAVDIVCAVGRLRFAREQSIEMDGLAFDDFSLAAFAYAMTNPAPVWLSQVMNDFEFVDKLVASMTPRSTTLRERFGANATTLTSYLKMSAGAVGAAAMALRKAAESSARSTAAALNRGRAMPADLVRLIAHCGISRFIGDVASYLIQRPHPGGGLLDAVRTSLDEATLVGLREQEPLVAVGHSLGGVLLFDVLSSATAPRVDLLVTVGSQVGLFASLGAFGRHAAGAKLQRPQTVVRWLNVFDANDVLSFAASPLFDGVEDYRFALDALSFDHHGAYLFSQRFHDRLRARVAPAA